jgi:PncC family amidohydrolase
MTEKPLEYIVANLLRQRGWRLAVAESCTGGLVGHRMTNVPGSSTYYLGSVTAYAYEAKVRLLGVKWESLEKHGAVSEKVVLEMALGVRRTFAADIGLAVSGIAGPGGGTPEKPVGYTWIGLNTAIFEAARQFTWNQDRLGNKALSAEATLQLLADFLRDQMNE